MIDFDDVDDPLTPYEQVLLDLRFQLDEAFRQDPSIAAMNRVFRRLRTGRPEIDDELRDYIGFLYRFEEARPALLAEPRANLVRPSYGV